MKSQNNIFFKLLVLPAMLLLLGSNLQAQKTKANQKHKAFEGSLSYAVRLSGKKAAEILENDPANVMDLHIKEDNFIVNLSGGRIARTFLFIGDSNHTYIVDAPNRRAFKRTYYIDTNYVAPVATATGEEVQVKGISCQEFKLENKEKGETILFYVSDQYRVDLDLYKDKEKAKADFLVKGLEGRIPLRKVIKSSQMTTELDLRYIKPRFLEPENFLIPRSFKLKGRDPRK